jgi:hypothetical protein
VEQNNEYQTVTVLYRTEHTIGATKDLRWFLGITPVMLDARSPRHQNLLQFQNFFNSLSVINNKSSLRPLLLG